MAIDPKKLKAALPPGTVMECIYFEAYIHPHGFLDKNKESHALFWYYLNARRAYDEYADRMEVVLEGDRDPTTNYEQLFESIAFQYNVKPEHMAKCWDLVDLQAKKLGMPLLPQEQRYRFQSIIVVH